MNSIQGTAAQGYPSQAPDDEQDQGTAPVKQLSEAQVLKRATALFEHLTPRAQSRVLSYLTDKAYEGQCTAPVPSNN